jgi:hypothetical protein
MLSPRASVVMVDGGFRDRFHAVDSFCSQDLEPGAYEVLWVEHSDRVRPDLRELERRYPHFRVLCLGRRLPYHSSFCFNAGIAAARADVVFIPDGDVLVAPDFLGRALEEHRADDRLVLYFYRIEEPQSAAGGPADIDQVKRTGRIANASNYGGCLSVRRSWLEAINGYEQHPLFALGNHCNDIDVHARLKILGLHVAWHPELMLYHPWHPGTGRWHGTTVGESLWKLQSVLTQCRASDLEPVALRGIDPARDRVLPEPWWRALDAEATRLALPPAVKQIWGDEAFPLERLETLRQQRPGIWSLGVRISRSLRARGTRLLYRLPQVSIDRLAPSAPLPGAVIEDDRNLPPRPDLAWPTGDGRMMRPVHDDVTPLLRILAHLKPRLVLELGTAHGNTTANICRFSAARVVTVNALPEQLSGTVTTFALSREEIGRVYQAHGFADRVTQVHANTLQFRPTDHVDPGKVDLAIVDACHDFDYVTADFLKVAPLMREGGMVLLHDTHPSRMDHLRGSYDACVWLRRQGHDIRHVRGTWWAYWVAGSRRPA